MKTVFLSLLLGFLGMEIGLRLNIFISTYVFAVIGVLIPPIFIMLKSLFKEVKA